MSSTDDHEMRVSKIESGTVIDHVAAGQALNVLAILGIDGTRGDTVSVGMHVPSERLGRKDILKIEGRELTPAEVDVLSLIAPDATINIIRDYEVVDKHRVERTEIVRGILSCPNPACITNEDEPVETEFGVLDDGVRCMYCGSIVREDLAAYIHVD